MNSKKYITKFFIISFMVLSCEDNSYNPAAFEAYISDYFDQDPAVSHNGNLIAYFHESIYSFRVTLYPKPADDPSGLYIMNSDGKNNRLLLKGHHSSPSWSPDDQWIVFSTNGLLQIINLTGDSIRTFMDMDKIPGPAQHPDWSPDGKSILFSCPTDRGGGYTCTPDFKNLKQIYITEKFMAFPINWLSSSEYLCSLFCKDYSSREVFIVDTSLTNLTRLTFSKNSDLEPSASPSQEYIAWNCDGRIFLMNKDGSNKKKLNYGKTPSWTPDSKHIIYSNANLDFTKGVIWKMDLEGKNKTQLTF
jgi:Tol biopolymer transport system component